MRQTEPAVSITRFNENGTECSGCCCCIYSSPRAPREEPKGSTATIAPTIRPSVAAPSLPDFPDRHYQTMLTFVDGGPGCAHGRR